MCARAAPSTHEPGRLGTHTPAEGDQCRHSASAKVAGHIEPRAQGARDGDVVQLGDIGGAKIRDHDSNSMTRALPDIGPPWDQQGKWHVTRHWPRTAEGGHPPERRSTEATQ